MKIDRLFDLARAGVIAAAITLTAFALMGAQNDTNEKESLRATRAGTPAAGLPQTVSTSTGASVSFTALSKNTVYLLRCTTDTRLCMGTSACTATASHWPLPPSVFPILTTETMIHLGVRARSTNGACWLLEYN